MHAVFSYRAILTLVLAVSFATYGSAQSSSQEFPTAVTSNEVSGTIKARDIGDSRLTTFYYTFNGEQGDLFINLVTRNFAGDIDVFTMSGLRPLTKIVVYADYGESETGRAIYLRKPEKLLLRVQGRTPNDDEATFRLKFAGSFLAVRPDDVPAAPELPRVSGETRAANRVNSVGTLLPTPAKTDEAVADKNPSASEPPDPVSPAQNSDPAKVEKDTARTAVVVSDPVQTAEKIEETRPEPPRNIRRPGNRRNARTVPAEPATEAPEKRSGEQAVAESGKEGAKDEPAKTERRRETSTPAFRTLTDNRRVRAPKKEAEPKVDPLDSINLVVQFKNGESLEKKMSEVFKFTVDKGVLTVVLKNGSVTRYPIVEVAKVTIE